MHEYLSFELHFVNNLVMDWNNLSQRNNFLHCEVKIYNTTENITLLTAIHMLLNLQLESLILQANCFCIWLDDRKTGVVILPMSSWSKAELQLIIYVDLHVRKCCKNI